jgi:hypothetical protein
MFNVENTSRSADFYLKLVLDDADIIAEAQAKQIKVQ